jgi:hypothetical protein
MHGVPLALSIIGCGMSVVVACSGSDEASVDEVDIEVEEVEGNVLAFGLQVTTDAPAEITVRAERDDGHTVEVPVLTPAAEETDIPLVGLRPESTYSVVVTATGDDGDAVDAPAEEVRTGALPPDLPPVDLVSSDVDRMEPGLTLFNVITPFAPPPEEVEPGEEPLAGLLLAVDESGEVVWYLRTPAAMGDVELIPGGMLVEVYDTIAREIDLLGGIRREWAGRIVTEEFPEDRYGRTVASADAQPVDVDSFHHEVSRLPSGNLLSLTTELHATPGFDGPRCGEPAADFDGTYQIISDTVVEVDPDGNVVGRWPIYDILDPVTDPATQAMCRNMFAAAVPTWMYAPQSGVDWSHGNAVTLDEERNALIVSLRHLNAVLAIRYAADDDGPAGELLWRLGPGGDLQLTAGDWQFHQHAPEVQDDGSLLVYDNGNTRPGTTDDPATPAGEPVYSRAVLYDIDDEDGTVRQLWEHRGEIDGAPGYAFFLGDVDRLANGNVLINHGGLANRPDGISAQIIEVVPDGSSGGDVVWELRLSDGRHVYRAERVPSLYTASG